MSTGPTKGPSVRGHFLAEMEKTGVSREKSIRLKEKSAAVHEALKSFPTAGMTQNQLKKLTSTIANAWDQAATQFDADNALSRVSAIRTVFQLESTEEMMTFLKEANFTDSEIETLTQMSKQNFEVLQRGGAEAIALWQTSIAATEKQILDKNIQDFSQRLQDIGLPLEMISSLVLSKCTEDQIRLITLVFGSNPSVLNILEGIGRASVLQKLEQVWVEVLQAKTTELLGKITESKTSYTESERTNIDEIKTALTEDGLPEIVIQSRYAPAYETLRTIEEKRAIRETLKELESLGIDRSSPLLELVKDQLPNTEGNFATEASSADLKTLRKTLESIKVETKTSESAVTTKQTIVMLHLSLKNLGLTDQAINNNLPAPQQKTFEKLADPKALIPLRELKDLEEQLKATQSLAEKIIEMEGSLPKKMDLINCLQIDNQLEKKNRISFSPENTVSNLKNRVPLAELANAMKIAATGSEEMISARRNLLDAGFSEKQILEELKKRPSKPENLTFSGDASADALENIYRERQLQDLGVTQNDPLLEGIDKKDEKALGKALQQMISSHQYLKDKCPLPGQKERRIKEFYTSVRKLYPERVQPTGEPSLEKVYHALGPELFAKHWEELTSTEDVIYDLRASGFEDRKIAQAIREQIPKEEKKNRPSTNLSSLRSTYPLSILKAASPLAEKSLREGLNKRESTALETLTKNGIFGDELIYQMIKLLEPAKQHNGTYLGRQRGTFEIRFEAHHVKLRSPVTFKNLKENVPPGLFVDALEHLANNLDNSNRRITS